MRFHSRQRTPRQTRDARQQAKAGELQPKLFPILDGTEACHRQKMAMQACPAHPACITQCLDAKSSVVVVPDPGNGSPDATWAIIKQDVLSRCLLSDVTKGHITGTPEELGLPQRNCYRVAKRRSK